jgi:hypothetical protein
VNCELKKVVYYMEDIYLVKNRLSEIKTMVEELGVSL